MSRGAGQAEPSILHLISFWVGESIVAEFCFCALHRVVWQLYHFLWQSYDIMWHQIWHIMTFCYMIWHLMKYYDILYDILWHDKLYHVIWQLYKVSYDNYVISYASYMTSNVMTSDMIYYDMIWHLMTSQWHLRTSYYIMSNLMTWYDITNPSKRANLIRVGLFPLVFLRIVVG